MNELVNNSRNETQPMIKKILDFIMGFVGSLIVGTLGLLLFTQFDPQRMWMSYFQWFWILVLAVLAVIFYIKKRIWISAGLVAAMILMAF